MRRPPKEVPPPIELGMVEEDVRTYRFLTPVFGGGVDLQKPDPITPVRIASIRGQLRFWWRAANLRGCTTVKELREAEAEVFGSMTKASALVVRVSKQLGPPDHVAVFTNGSRFGVEDGMKAIAYGAFPLRATQEQYTHGELSYFADKEFVIAFSYPASIEGDVQAALWAWAHFGSLGGRTRRGFGAIAQVTPDLLGIDDGWERFVKPVVVPWPHLAERPTFGKRVHDDGMAALKRLLDVLSRVRQGDDVGRRSGPGRSFWSEADSIRRLFPDQVGEKHRDLLTNQHCFPRAAFGAPIIFHFKKPNEKASAAEKAYAKDPESSTLLPTGKKRFASRLLLRPHLEANQVKAMAIVLAHPAPPKGYVLLQEGQKEIGVSVDLETPLLLGDGSEVLDPIQHFLKELSR